MACFKFQNLPRGIINPIEEREKISDSGCLGFTGFTILNFTFGVPMLLDEESRGPSRLEIFVDIFHNDGSATLPQGSELIFMQLLPG